MMPSLWYKIIPRGIRDEDGVLTDRMLGVTKVLAAASPIAHAPITTAAAATLINLVEQVCARDGQMTREAANIPGGREALGILGGS